MIHKAALLRYALFGMQKPAATDFDVHPLIRERWSPRAFSQQRVSASELRSLLEAARWAASASNEQPWRFIVAPRENAAEFARLLACLNESNQRWAQHAAVLMLTVASTTFARNGKPNRHALHDVGQAIAQLSLQATSMGLFVHQMGGFSQEKARETYSIPSDFEPVAAVALGYPGDTNALPDDLRERELAPRARKPQSELVFSGVWGKPLEGE